MKLTQPIAFDKYGTIRFVENKAVSRLLDESQKRGFGLNELQALLCIGEIPETDMEQLAQLIGYSVDGFHELSYVSDEAAHEARLAANLLEKK